MEKRDEVALREAAEHARTILTRVAGPGGLLDQMTDRGGSEARPVEELRDLQALLEVMTERVRWTRQVADQGPLSELAPLVTRLPLNRKERYYTGTVLPMLIASDGFAHLQRFLSLCGLRGVGPRPGLDGDQDIQFITEYGFAESVFTDADKEFWPDKLAADTPDIVIAGPDWLLAVEAKMFHNPSRSDLEAQMRRQQGLVDLWGSQLGYGAEQVRHVLLLPGRLAERVDPLAYPIVTWEEVLGAYTAVGPRYWSRILAVALERHEHLESSRALTFRSNAHAVLTGADIVEAFGRGELLFDAVGRNGGLRGKKFRGDVSSGGWRTTTYEVRSGGPANNHWFTVTEFIAAVTAERGE